ncbi:MAG: hypothetical protein H0X26_00040 [Alphaproteobacteria bacterium]|nr:hypothetical protein [Alphaproteobacteria bacterium]
MFFNKRNFFIGSVVLFISIISVIFYFLSTDEYADSKFRTMQNKIASTESVDLTGLDKLSASGGPIMDFPTLKNKLGFVTKPIIIVDSMKEHHGYINDIPITFFGYHRKKPDLRYFLRRLFFTGTSQSQHELIVQEREVAQKYGFGYANIRIDSKCVTPDARVEEFVTYFDQAPENVWFHFHCRHGKGRTSIALVMYDIMKNAPEVSLEDIVRRQYLLGSVNLSDVAAWRKNSTYPSQALERRKKFIQQFYAFICQRKAGGVRRWSEWRASPPTSVVPALAGNH